MSIYRQLDKKCASLSSPFTLCPETTAVGFDDLVGYIKPDSPAGGINFLCPFSSFKSFFKKPGNFLFFHPNPGISNNNFQFYRRSYYELLENHLRDKVYFFNNLINSSIDKFNSFIIERSNPFLISLL